MLVLSEHWIFTLFLQFYGVFLFFEYYLSSGGIFLFFRFIFRRCFLCIYPFITLVSCFVYFGRAESPGFSGGPGHIFFLRGAPLCGVSVRYYLFEP
jgi:hypothetical protein